MIAPLAAALALLIAGQETVLQIRVIQGEGAVNTVGTRGPGVTLEVTDELGNPVEGAVVSLRLPDDGPSGSFAGGLASEILTTGKDGRIMTAPIRWNHFVGPVQIRVTVAKDRVRAGTVISQRLIASGASRTTTREITSQSKPHSKWFWIAIIGAGAAGAGLAAGLAGHGGSGQPNTPATAAGLTIGTPTVTITRP
jgi:hypothetical protein